MSRGFAGSVRPGALCGSGSGPALPEARQVANSNRIQLAARVDNRTKPTFALSSLDNLGKGNASQAIQAANLASGLTKRWA